ncbi:GNAT family N-acetyltransferase [Oscillibacter valericigenes]|uniref:GNAT family N-acetyltransferase n=1 Tax=Oscillibacter valericigenes TaxID=351091 RepID=UPI0038B402C9
MKCTLRRWRLSDAKELAAALNNEHILNNLRDGLPIPYTERDAEDYITAMLSADGNDTFACAITLDGRVVGSIGAFRQGNIHRQTAELGYYLAEEYWGRGIMTDAICQLCAMVFETTDILRIYAEPFAYNAGSRRALEKAGFAFEGMMKSNAVKNGKVVDMALYSLTRSLEPYPVRRLSPEEIPAALELCWQVFLQFEAPEYPPEGVAAFRASLDDRERTRQLKFYGAFDGEKLVGVLAMRLPQHIGGFFVAAAYHRRGIGRHLFEAMRRDYQTQIFTVNSSPYAVEVYRHLGFVPTDTEQLTDGLRYTPMRFEQDGNGL